MRASSAPAGALAISVLAVTPVTAVDAGHIGAHHTLLVSFAADAQACCGRRWRPAVLSLRQKAVQALGKQGRGVFRWPLNQLAGAIAFSQDIPDVLRPD